MRVFVTGDWHLGVSNYGITTDDGRNSRLDDAEDVINRMVEWCGKNSIDMFVMSGDIFHTNRPGQDEQLAFLRILRKLEGCSFKSRFIIGNHDFNSKVGAPHALKIFQQIIKSSFQIKIFSDTTWELLECDGKNLLTCYYPYKGVPPDWAEMAKYSALDSTALVCHSHLAGAVVGAEPFEIKDDSATNVGNLPVDHVWAGHFHKPQHLCDQPLAFYPGSPYAVDFNERLDVKGGVVVNAFERTYETVGFETRKLYQISINGSKELSDLQTLSLRAVEDSIVKVVVTLDEIDAHLFDESLIREKLISLGAHSIASINLNVLRKLAQRNPDIKLDNDLKMNFAKFIGSKDYGEHDDAVRSKGFEIIQKCAQ